jgi:regulatory protein
LSGDSRERPAVDGMGTEGKRADRPPSKSLKARAVALLARREYSRADLRKKLLARREHSADELSAVDRVLDELAVLGFLSDERFASDLIRAKSGRYTKRAIAQLLEASGVPQEVAAAALDAVDVDDRSALVALWRRRFGRAPADDRDKARQIRYLQARGFSLSAILQLLRKPPTEESASE